jgi:hypothetical protein
MKNLNQFASDQATNLFDLAYERGVYIPDSFIPMPDTFIEGHLDNYKEPILRKIEEAVIEEVESNPDYYIEEGDYVYQPELMDSCTYPFENTFEELWLQTFPPDNGYNVFLMVELAKVHEIITTILEYDLQWEIGLNLWEKFKYSTHNNAHKSMYESIESFLQSLNPTKQ